MKITFYLRAGRKNNLYCLISDGKKRRAFSMEYTRDLKLWNLKKNEINIDNPYFFTLENFKRYLLYRYFKLKTEEKDNILGVLKEESLNLLKNSGLEGLSRNIFNIMSVNKLGLPKYDGYIFAFEKYTGLKNKDYRVENHDYFLHFHTKKRTYEMDTYEGKTALLKDIIQKRSYFDITELTDDDKWSEICDEQMPKEKFLTEMCKELEYCLEVNYRRTEISMGSNENMEEIKRKLWKQFETFTNYYSQANVINLSIEINKNILYPIAVIVMTSIFDLEACCAEYCELEFSERGWKTIFIDNELEEDDDDLPVFYIKSYI